jgi:hypothetical protein
MPYDPTKDPTLVLWLDSSDAATVTKTQGTGVAVWRDKRNGTGVSLSPVRGSAAPVVAAQGIDFTNAALGTALPVTEGSTLILACRATAALQTVFDHHGQALRVGPKLASWYDANIELGGDEQTVVIACTVAGVARMAVATATGVVMASGEATRGFLPNGASPMPLVLGNAVIYELAYFAAAKDAPFISSIVGHLAEKWLTHDPSAPADRRSAREGPAPAPAPTSLPTNEPAAPAVSQAPAAGPVPVPSAVPAPPPVPAATPAPTSLPLAFEARFRLPRAAGLELGVVDGATWSSKNTSYAGVVVDHAFEGDFALTVAWASRAGAAGNTVHAIVCGASASPADFALAGSPEYYTAAGVRALFAGAGAPYRVPLHFYNSADWDSANFAASPRTYYRYTRVADVVALARADELSGPWLPLKSASVLATDRAMCLIGTCAGNKVPSTAEIIAF